MYQGKFDAKKKKTGVDIHEIVAQRNSAAAKKQSPSRPRTPQPTPVKTRKGPRTGSVVFYSLFFLFVLLFYVATFFVLQWLQGWLVDYENSQPTRKCQEVFDQLFADPDWEALYDAAGIGSAAYTGKESFVAYMEDKVGSTELTYAETSAGLSEDKKYIVRMGDEKIASFTLVDENKAETNTELPDWQLGAIAFFFELDETYLIQYQEGHTVSVNGVPLDDSNAIQIATMKAQDYLPIGANSPRILTQEISGLMAQPTVTIADENGTEMPVIYDEATGTFVEQVSGTIGEEEKEVALNTVKAYAKYMTCHAGAGEVAKYFVKSSSVYETIIKSDLSAVQDDKGYTFVDETVSDYCRYNDSLFSVRVSMTMNLNRADGSVKENAIEQSLFFNKQESGNWMCYDMTAVDVSELIAEVRLTFMNGNTVLSSEFHSTTASQLTCPQVTAPEGKVFSGWMVEKVDESGNTVMQLAFTPDENGVVTIPAGFKLEPMTLYPLFEDAQA